MFLEICPISSNAQPRTAGRGTTAPWTAPLYRLRPSATTFPADFLEHLISGHRNKSRASFVQSASPYFHFLLAGIHQFFPIGFLINLFPDLIILFPHGFNIFRPALTRIRINRLRHMNGVFLHIKSVIP